MKLASLVLIAALGCETATTSADFGTTITGLCRVPSACYVAAACACSGGTVDDCRVTTCDPASPAGCDCTQTPGSACLEPAQVCVGRGPACDGVCVRPGNACQGASGTPPEFVDVTSADEDGGAITHERRCAFLDDLCCPAAISRDAGVDLSVSD